MILESIRASVLSIPFNAAFKHASAERASTQTLWVEARNRDGVCGYGESCPREYVTTESLTSSQAFVTAHTADWLAAIRNVGTLADWTRRHRADIDANPAAWAAVELALLDLLGKEQGYSVEALLGVPEVAGCFRYTAVLGDASPRQFEVQLAHYIQAGFRDFKIKLSGNRERDFAKTRALTTAGINANAVRADANNLWSETAAAVKYLRALDFKFFAIEEPLRAGDYTGMQEIAGAIDAKIILDESLLRGDQVGRFAESAERWIVNLRVSKMGGLLRSLELVGEVRRTGLRLIVGAHVGETSVLTRAALTVANSARDVLLAQEGAFGTHLLAYDVIEPPLMFGPGGMLDVDELNFAAKSGLGLALAQASPTAPPIDSYISRNAL